MLNKVLLLFQFAPLSIFITIAKRGQLTNEAWERAFIWGGLFALGETLFLILKTKPLNRLLLGVNIYLLIGAISTATGLLWLLRLYSQLQATAIFVVIFGVGLFTTHFTARGFLGISGPTKDQTIRMSYLLITFTLLCGLFSFFFRGDVFLSGTLPVLLLILAKWVLTKRVEKLATSMVKS